MKKIAVFLLAVLLIASVAQAITFFTTPQQVTVYSDHASKTYIMNLTSFANLTVTAQILPVAPYTYDVGYNCGYNMWIGMYIYDYTTGGWEELNYLWNENLTPP